MSDSPSQFPETPNVVADASAAVPVKIAVTAAPPSGSINESPGEAIPAADLAPISDPTPTPTPDPTPDLAPAFAPATQAIPLTEIPAMPAAADITLTAPAAVPIAIATPVPEIDSTAEPTFVPPPSATVQPFNSAGGPPSPASKSSRHPNRLVLAGVGGFVVVGLAVGGGVLYFNQGAATPEASTASSVVHSAASRSAAIDTTTLQNDLKSADASFSDLGASLKDADASLADQQGDLSE